MSPHGLLGSLIAPAMSQVTDFDMALVDHVMESMQRAMTILEIRGWYLERDDPKRQCLKTFPK